MKEAEKAAWKAVSKDCATEGVWRGEVMSA